MKKTLLLIAVLAAFSAKSQITIQEYGTGPDISGSTINVIINPLEINPTEDIQYWTNTYRVTNNTGADGDWYITRVKVSVPAGWSDDICWPPSCFLTNNSVVFETPHGPEPEFEPAPTIVNGTSNATHLGSNYPADIKPQVTPDFTMNGNATYKYYITDAYSGEHLDSLTINFSYPLLSTKTLSQSTTLSIAPNPANDFVDITLEGSETANIKIVDVLGNMVYSKQVTGTAKVGTSDFKSGVYFVTIQGENKKAITKKLIVRH